MFINDYNPVYSRLMRIPRKRKKKGREERKRNKVTVCHPSTMIDYNNKKIYLNGEKEIHLCLCLSNFLNRSDFT